ncbi:MAG: hypothetical protein JXR26_11175 [Balneolaceae bacterium]|nr:hypothetical protein [Balneolaceae bacterium]
MNAYPADAPLFLLHSDGLRSTFDNILTLTSVEWSCSPPAARKHSKAI